jgi:8-oxo-dGTP pyrophosphatase MutT (NUDIX family)
MPQPYRPPRYRNRLAVGTYVPPIPRSSGYPAVKTLVKYQSGTQKSTHTGASILLFSVTPTGNIYFLLGEEAVHEGYKDSGKWSDFGGGAKVYEDEYTCAAREFLEETQRTINPFPEKYGHSFPDIFMITQELKHGNYTARIDFNFLNTTYPRTYTTFLVEIPWDPTLRARFSKRVRSNSPHPFPSANRYSNFQGKLNSKRRGDLEKTAIEFFSIPCLLGETRHQITPRDYVPEFRPFFMRRMRKIIALTFPKNLSQYQTLDNPEACRALYQGAGLRIPMLPAKSTNTATWARGAQVLMQSVELPITTQPPSRIFQHFNTHRKYPITEHREPVDKIYF